MEIRINLCNSEHNYYSNVYSCKIAIAMLQ